ncbi:MAG: hypothetical protein VCA34_12875, partial [Roseibacillus sp.]
RRETVIELGRFTAWSLRDHSRGSNSEDVAGGSLMAGCSPIQAAVARKSTRGRSMIPRATILVSSGVRLAV